LVNYLYLLIGISLLLSICVSGSKNKMGSLYSNISISNKKSEVSNIDGSRSANVSYPNFAGEKDDFFFWFSGFTDAEGNFFITIDRSFVKFRFKILLHIDDIEALNIIKSKLNVGRVTVEINRDRCSFIVEKYDEIRNVICPLFKSYPLHTSKRLDYEDFNEAVLIKDYINKNLSEAEMERIISLKKGMNSNRETFTYQTSKSQIIINPSWFIGFLEGEGTFGIKTGSALYFQVAQKNTSQESLNAITTFLIELPSVLPNSKILPMNVVSTINAKTGVVSLVVNSVDSLYYCVLPYLESSNMYTRKAIYFKLWRIALLLKIHGYYFLPEGKNLFLDISDTINKRYSTSTSTRKTDEIIREIFERSQAILAKDPPFDVNANIPHIDNVRKLSIANRSLNPIVVYIYENNNMVKGSPFASYSAAHKSLGLKPSSNTCNRYIDTDRLYKNKYIFSSKPIDSASKV
jgi:hypothetical protein